VSNKTYAGRKPKTRVCKHEPCSKRFTFRRADQLYCAPRCKKAHARNIERRKEGLPEITTAPKPRRTQLRPRKVVEILRKGDYTRSGDRGPKSSMISMASRRPKNTSRRPSGGVRYTWPAHHVDPQSPRPDPSDVQELIVKLANRDGGLFDPVINSRLAALDRAVALGRLTRKQFETEAAVLLQDLLPAIPGTLIRAEALVREDPAAFMAQVEQQDRQQEPAQRELVGDRYGYYRSRERDPRLPPPHEHADPSSRAYSPAYAAWLAKRRAAEQPVPAIAA
jgi:hypothetical protein